MTGPMTGRARPGSEPSIALPTGLLLASVCGSAMATSFGWLAVVWVGGFGWEVGVAGPAGAAVVAGVGVVAVVAMQPWRSRPVISWVTIWLAAIVGRLLLTPAAAFLLYSAAPLGGTPLLLSIAITYVIVQVCEAAVLAMHVQRVT